MKISGCLTRINETEWFPGPNEWKFMNINEFPDHDSDKATGKNTLIVVFGPEKARVGYVALVTGAFLSIVFLVLNGTFPSLILITLLASYFGITSIQTLYKYYNDRLLEPANWGTIIMHSVTGLLLFIGLWLGNPIA